MNTDKEQLKNLLKGFIPNSLADIEGGIYLAYVNKKINKIDLKKLANNIKTFANAIQDNQETLVNWGNYELY